MSSLTLLNSNSAFQSNTNPFIEVLEAIDKSISYERWPGNRNPSPELRLAFYRDKNKQLYLELCKKYFRYSGLNNRYPVNALLLYSPNDLKSGDEGASLAFIFSRAMLADLVLIIKSDTYETWHIEYLQVILFYCYKNYILVSHDQKFSSLLKELTKLYCERERQWGQMGQKELGALTTLVAINSMAKANSASAMIKKLLLANDAVVLNTLNIINDLSGGALAEDNSIADLLNDYSLEYSVICNTPMSILEDYSLANKMNAIEGFIAVYQHDAIIAIIDILPNNAYMSQYLSPMEIGYARAVKSGFIQRYYVNRLLAHRPSLTALIDIIFESDLSDNERYSMICGLLVSASVNGYKYCEVNAAATKYLENDRSTYQNAAVLAIIAECYGRLG
jgi:hypothetical protein